MYYLNCVNQLVDVLEREATDYQNYSRVSSDVQRAVVGLAVFLSPDEILGKLLFVVRAGSPVLNGRSNEFYEISKATTILAGVSGEIGTIVYGGKKIQSSTFMVCTENWLETYFIDPLKAECWRLKKAEPTPLKPVTYYASAPAYESSEYQPLTHDRSEYIGDEPAPHVPFAFFYGLIALSTFLGFVYFFIYESTPELLYLTGPFALTSVSLAYGFVWVLSALITFCCCCCNWKSRSKHHSFLWIFVTQVLFVGTFLVIWYLWKYHNMCANEYNQCVALFSADAVMSALSMCLSFTESADPTIGFFFMIMGVTVGLVLWDTSIPWDWGAFSLEHWKPLVTVSAIVILLTLTVMSMKKSIMSHTNSHSAFIQVLFYHSTLGFLFIAGAAGGLEVYPGYEALKLIIQTANWGPLGWRYGVALAICAAWIFSIKGLTRYSDHATTTFTFKLSVLLPIAAVFVQRNIDGDWKNIIQNNPVFSAGLAGVIVCLLYWVLRISTLSCCHHRAHGRSGCYPKKILADASG